MSIEINEENIDYTVRDGIVYNKDYSTIYFYPKDKTDTVLKIPSTVKEVNYAFIEGVSNNKYLQSIEVEGRSDIFTANGTSLYNYAGNKLYFNLDDMGYFKNIYRKEI